MMDRISFTETPRGRFWTGRPIILKTLPQILRYKTFKKGDHGWSKCKNLRGENCSHIQCSDILGRTK